MDIQDGSCNYNKQKVFHTKFAKIIFFCNEDQFFEWNYTLFNNFLPHFLTSEKIIFIFKYAQIIHTIILIWSNYTIHPACIRQTKRVPMHFARRWIYTFPFYLISRLAVWRHWRISERKWNGTIDTPFPFIYIYIHLVYLNNNNNKCEHRVWKKNFYPSSDERLCIKYEKKDRDISISEREREKYMFEKRNVFIRLFLAKAARAWCVFIRIIVRPSGKQEARKRSV